MVGACEKHGIYDNDKENLSVKNQKGLLAKPRRRCKNNIKTDLKVTGSVGVDWIYLSDNCGNGLTL
jgi:hypothetical protein